MLVATTVVGLGLFFQFWQLTSQVWVTHQRDLSFKLMHMGTFLLGFSILGQKYAA